MCFPFANCQPARGLRLLWSILVIYPCKLPIRKEKITIPIWFVSIENTIGELVEGYCKGVEIYYYESRNDYAIFLVLMMIMDIRSHGWFVFVVFRRRRKTKEQRQIQPKLRFIKRILVEWVLIGRSWRTDLDFLIRREMETAALCLVKESQTHIL